MSAVALCVSARNRLKPMGAEARLLPLLEEAARRAAGFLDPIGLGAGRADG